MNLRLRVLSLCAFLLISVGCGSKSETTQQNTQYGPTSTPQQTASISNIAVSEQQSNSNGAITSDEAKSGVCALLTSKEIASVQGEAVASFKGSEHNDSGLITSQCFYQLPTFNKSVSLQTIRRTPANASSDAIKEFWEKRFHGRAEGKGEREKQNEERGQEREEEESSTPQPVTGIGDQAFWVGNRVSASLYVLKKDTVVRISVGGPNDRATSIKKSKLLAQQVINRL